MHVNQNCDCVDEMGQQELMKKIMCDKFAVTDLALYCNTHPEDINAIQLHNQYASRARELMNQYQSMYGPLTNGYPVDTWKWLNQPWPWQKGAY